jgi:apolipoprotein N-acyltransferase
MLFINGNRIINNILLLLLFSLLAIATFYSYSIFIFVLFIPLFIFLTSCKGFLTHFLILLSFFLFNIIGSFWLYKINQETGLLIWFSNSLIAYLFILPSLIFVKNKSIQPLFFISLILLFEQVHHIWDLNWPWLTLGNTIGDFPVLIQWYKYTGNIGGSLWILLINYLFYKLFANCTKKVIFIFSFIVYIPLFLSIYLYNKKESVAKNHISLIGLLPNSDCRYSPISNDVLIDSLFIPNICDSAKPKLYILPENMIDDDIWWEKPNDSRIINKIRKKIKSNSCIFGSTISSGALQGLNNYSYSSYQMPYSKFNTAICIDSTSTVNVHVKRKLIPKEEYYPFEYGKKYFSSDFLSKGADYNNFTINESKITSLICYESLFGQETANFVKKGSEAILILSNEQLFPFIEALSFYKKICSIRAIENNRYVAKFSNIGFSGVFDTKGDVIFSASKQKFAKFYYNLPLITKLTFYTKNANSIHFIFYVLPFLVFIFHWYFKNFFKATY